MPALLPPQFSLKARRRVCSRMARNRSRRRAVPSSGARWYQLQVMKCRSRAP